MSHFRLKPKTVEANWWDYSTGWQGFEALAEWCGGSVHRDHSPMDREKSYYWSIEVPGVEGRFAPQSVILRNEDNSYEVITEKEFRNNYEEI